MKTVLRVVLFQLVILVGLFAVCNLLLGFCANTVWSKEIEQPKSITLDEEGIAQLRMFKKEIARLQYSEFCATVKAIPDVVMNIGKGAEKAAEAGDTNAKALLEWLGPIVQKYEKAGCHDA